MSERCQTCKQPLPSAGSPRPMKLWISRDDYGRYWLSCRFRRPKWLKPYPGGRVPNIGETISMKQARALLGGDMEPGTMRAVEVVTK